MASFYDYARRYDEAIVQHQKALELDPNLWIAYSSLGLSYLQKSLNKETIAEAERTVALSPNNRLAVTSGLTTSKHGFFAGLTLRAGGGGPEGQRLPTWTPRCSEAEDRHARPWIRAIVKLDRTFATVP
jgi:tetratricopeptide (TPR) repeat protein